MDDDVVDLDFDEAVVNEGYDDFMAVLDHAREDMAAIEPIGQFAPAETLGPEPGLWEQASDWFIDKFVPEVWEGLEHEVSLGASELAKGLMGHSDAFVLYGPSLDPIETYDVPEQSFDDMLSDASQRGETTQEHEMER